MTITKVRVSRDCGKLLETLSLGRSNLLKCLYDDSSSCCGCSGRCASGGLSRLARASPHPPRARLRRRAWASVILRLGAGSGQQRYWPFLALLQRSPSWASVRKTHSGLRSPASAMPGKCSPTGALPPSARCWARPRRCWAHWPPPTPTRGPPSWARSLEANRVALRALRPLSRGESGAISLLGTLAALLGAALLGAFANAAWLAVTLGGFLGALADSVFGATLQAQWWDEQKKRWSEIPQGKPGRGVNWMRNDAVNILATLIGAVTALGLRHVLVH